MKLPRLLKKKNQKLQQHVYLWKKKKRRIGVSIDRGIASKKIVREIATNSIGRVSLSRKQSARK
jgi:hypothetical protein